jgi:hypothetical protein
MKDTLHTFDFDGVLTNSQVVKYLFKPIDLKKVVTSRDNTPENYEEIYAVTQGHCDIIMCNGFYSKCRELAELSRDYFVIHCDDDPAIKTFFENTDCDIEVKLIRNKEIRKTRRK